MTINALSKLYPRYSVIYLAGYSEVIDINSNIIKENQTNEENLKLLYLI